MSTAHKTLSHPFAILSSPARRWDTQADTSLFTLLQLLFVLGKGLRPKMAFARWIRTFVLPPACAPGGRRLVVLPCLAPVSTAAASACTRRETRRLAPKDEISWDRTDVETRRSKTSLVHRTTEHFTLCWRSACLSSFAHENAFSVLDVWRWHCYAWSKRWIKRRRPLFISSIFVCLCGEVQVMKTQWSFCGCTANL